MTAAPDPRTERERLTPPYETTSDAETVFNGGARLSPVSFFGGSQEKSDCNSNYNIVSLEIDMPCPVCTALALKRDRLWRAYSDAIAALGFCAPADAQEYLRLQSFAEESRIRFNLAATEFYQHTHDRHAVPI
jgi:hypothetical protein